MSSAVIVSLRIAATPARVFEAFTQDIAAWWRPDPLFAITPRGDGVLRFEGGEGGRLISEWAPGKVYEVGKITTWSPPTELSSGKLVFTWRPASLPPELATEAEVIFEAVAEETRVTVTHRGWAEIPRDHAVRHSFPEQLFLRHVGMWQRAQLKSLAVLSAGRVDVKR